MKKTGNEQEKYNRQGKLPARVFASLIGLVLCGVGISLFLYTGMGVDPASVLELGIANVIGISYGNAAALLNVVILVIVFLVDKHYIHISSFLAIFGIGYTADIMQRILGWAIKGEPNLILKVLMIVIGLCIMATGVATYINADLGVGAIDLVSEIISDKFHLTYRYVRIAGDISFVVIGFLMGGRVGVGTIVAAFMTGPVVQLVRPTVQKLWGPVLGEER